MERGARTDVFSDSLIDNASHIEGHWKKSWVLLYSFPGLQLLRQLNDLSEPSFPSAKTFDVVISLISLNYFLFLFFSFCYWRNNTCGLRGRVISELSLLLFSICPPTFCQLLNLAEISFLFLHYLPFFSIVTNTFFAQALCIFLNTITPPVWSSCLTFFTSNPSCDSLQISILFQPLESLNKNSMVTAVMKLIALWGIQILIN